MLESIERCSSIAEIGEIREELYEAGYIKRPTQKGNRKKETPKPLEFTSTEGYRILVGKNNTQNDYLTTKLASKNDLWFHVKNIPGSHVVVFCEGGAVSEETVLKVSLLMFKLILKVFSGSDFVFTACLIVCCSMLSVSTKNFC